MRRLATPLVAAAALTAAACTSPHAAETGATPRTAVMMPEVSLQGLVEHPDGAPHVLVRVLVLNHQAEDVRYDAMTLNLLMNGIPTVVGVTNDPIELAADERRELVVPARADLPSLAENMAFLGHGGHIAYRVYGQAVMDAAADDVDAAVIPYETVGLLTLKGAVPPQIGER